jgi:hypothetical protein
LICAFAVPSNAYKDARCAAIKKQCGGKFYANYCGANCCWWVETSEKAGHQLAGSAREEVCWGRA